MNTVLRNSALENVELHSLYRASKNWLSYIAFLEDELRFCKRLINQANSAVGREEFFMYKSNSQSLIGKLEKRKNLLLSKIFCFQSNLKCTMEELMDLSVEYLRKEHESIQSELYSLQPRIESLKEEMVHLVAV